MKWIYKILDFFLRILSLKKFWVDFQDTRIERKIKKSFVLRNDLQENPSVNVPVEIIKGKYEGLIYQYGTMEMRDGLVKYQYDPIRNAHVIDDEFERFAGEILMYLTRKRDYYDVITRNDGR